MSGLTRLAAILGTALAVGCTLTAHLPPLAATPGLTLASHTPAPTLTRESPTPTATTSPTPSSQPVTNTPPPPTPTDILTTRSTRETRDRVTLVRVVNLSRYHIAGATAEELETEMRSVGPVDPLGGFHWYALTEPLFDWRYPCECGDQGCAIGDVTMLLTIRYTIPIWAAPEDGAANLNAQWASFEAALFTHEQGHGELATECAWALGVAFAALPPASTCAELDHAVGAASQPVFGMCRANQRDYEEQTAHGRTQGVIWPP